MRGVPVFVAMLRESCTVNSARPSDAWFPRARVCMVPTGWDLKQGVLVCLRVGVLGVTLLVRV